MKRLILASASPRRRELLEQIGLNFEVIPSTCEEMITKETVLLNSQRIKNKIFSAVGECGIIPSLTVYKTEKRCIALIL